MIPPSPPPAPSRRWQRLLFVAWLLYLSGGLLWLAWQDALSRWLCR